MCDAIRDRRNREEPHGKESDPIPSSYSNGRYDPNTEQNRLKTTKKFSDHSGNAKQLGKLILKTSQKFLKEMDALSSQPIKKSRAVSLAADQIAIYWFP